MPPVVPPFLIGLVAAPLVKRLFKPLVRGVVKTSVGLALEVKKAAHDAGEGLQDLAAEVTAEMIGAQMATETHTGTATDTDTKSATKGRAVGAGTSTAKAH
jgi:hypothetical protein